MANNHTLRTFISINMNTSFIILLSFFILNSCGYSPNPKTENISEIEEKPIRIINTYQYDSLTIPLFFKSLTQDHLQDFLVVDSLEFNKFCSVTGVNRTDSSNIERYFTIKILHKIFTCQTASNCSKGEIVNIPYQWHWVEPNPRHEIYFVSSNTRLVDTKAPKEFSKYNSYADIDRTPYLFLSDFVHPELKYYAKTCDTFSTFGWCSEREMAFVALASTLNFEGKVVAIGNHSWSEFVIPLKLNAGEIQNFKLTVDNTFNSFSWTTIEALKIPRWKEYYGNTKLSGWYNRKAKSVSELRSIENHLVSNKSMSRIENKMVVYLEKKAKQISGS